MAHHKEFVQAWVDAHNKGQGIGGVSKKLNTTKQAVHARANSLRKKGVNLPKMPRPSVFDVEALNAIIDKKLA